MTNFFTGISRPSLPLSIESDILLLGERCKNSESLKTGLNSCQILQFRVHSVIHTTQILACQITVCVCVWYVYKNMSKQKRANLLCLRKQQEQTLISMGRKPSKGCKFQIQVYNWSKKSILHQLSFLQVNLQPYQKQKNKITSNNF